VWAALAIRVWTSTRASEERPAVGKLVTTSAGASLRGAVRGKYFGATRTSPVDSSQFSLKVPWRPVTASPSTRMTVPATAALCLAVEPLVGKTGAADEANGAIHDGQFAMGAVIGARPRIPAHGVIPGKATAQLAKRGEAAVGEGGTSDSVDDHPHLHAGSGALFELVVDLVRNAAFLEDIG